MTTHKPKKAVVLLNMGGPETLAEVRPFLYNLFKDPDIIPVPSWLRWLRVPLAWIIAKFRAPKSAEAYASIGGGSPLPRNDRSVAAKLTKLLGDGYTSTVAMRYWHPFTQEAVTKLRDEGIEHVILLPMYPQYSTTTTMSSLKDFEQVSARLGFRPKTVRGVRSWCRDPRYVKLMAEFLRGTLAGIPTELRTTAHVLFSAHSIPMDRVRMGDPYPQEVAATVEAVVAEINLDLPHSLAFQSRVGPVEWLGPPVPEALHKLAESGVKAVVVVPVAFVSDHVETLEEIDVMYCEMAHELGIGHFARVPTFNDDDRFVDLLSGLVRDTEQTPPWRDDRGVCEGISCYWRKDGRCDCIGR